jgi:hypothetical protein
LSSNNKCFSHLLFNYSKFLIKKIFLLFRRPPVFLTNRVDGRGEEGKRGRGEGEKRRRGEGEKGRRGEGEKGRRGEGEKGRRGEGGKGRRGEEYLIPELKAGGYSFKIQNPKFKIISSPCRVHKIILTSRRGFRIYRLVLLCS